MRFALVLLVLAWTLPAGVAQPSPAPAPTPYPFDGVPSLTDPDPFPISFERWGRARPLFSAGTLLRVGHVYVRDGRELTLELSVFSSESPEVRSPRPSAERYRGVQASWDQTYSVAPMAAPFDGATLYRRADPCGLAVWVDDGRAMVQAVADRASWSVESCADIEPTLLAALATMDLSAFGVPAAQSVPVPPAEQYARTVQPSYRDGREAVFPETIAGMERWELKHNSTSKDYRAGPSAARWAAAKYRGDGGAATLWLVDLAAAPLPVSGEAYLQGAKELHGDDVVLEAIGAFPGVRCTARRCARVGSTFSRAPFAEAVVDDRFVFGAMVSTGGGTSSVTNAELLREWDPDARARALLEATAQVDPARPDPYGEVVLPTPLRAAPSIRASFPATVGDWSARGGVFQSSTLPVRGFSYHHPDGREFTLTAQFWAETPPGERPDTDPAIVYESMVRGWADSVLDPLPQLPGEETRVFPSESPWIDETICRLSTWVLDGRVFLETEVRAEATEGSSGEWVGATCEDAHPVMRRALAAVDRSVLEAAATR